MMSGLMKSRFIWRRSNMKILRGGGEIADLNVVLGACLQEALEPRAGMFRALAFVAVREQQHNAARAAAISILPRR